ncbi:hypothetical protein BGW80DRAFT_231616 [Lactifluus volemus]|nr:hypothetical protein BGW80DRAFT_231616 [Lactifluus volemus]
MRRRVTITRLAGLVSFGDEDRRGSQPSFEFTRRGISHSQRCIRLYNSLPTTHQCAHEQVLNGFLERPDAIESGEEIRNLRREFVREVGKALEHLERRVSEQALASEDFGQTSSPKM